MIGRMLVTLGLVVLAALHVEVTEQTVAPALAVLLALGGTAVGPRFDLEQAAQALVLVGTALLAFALALVDLPLDPNEGGPRIQYVLASGTALLTVACRLWMTEPEQGEAGTWVVGLVALASCGRVASALFLPLAAAFVVLSWAHAAWRSPAGRHRSARHVLGGVAMIVGSVVVAGGAAAALRLVSNGASAFVLAQINGPEAGFGAGSFELTSMDGMRQSDEVILRVHGPAPERFVGQVYREYVAGTWLPPGGKPQSAPAGRSPSGPVTTIEFVSDDEERLFLPADAGAVEARPPAVMVDGLGVPRPGAEAPEEVRFDTTGPLRLPRALPSPADLDLSPGVREALAPLVADWTGGADSPRARVEAITRHLEADFTYSLHYERDAEGDPVVQFLLDSRLGHCEYFASGLVLAARQAGVPARVVTGFRSTEDSPFRGHRIVRSRDAHAWAEVWLDGAWVEVDPSPQNSLEESAARSFLAGALDDLSVFWDRYGAQGLVGVLLLVFVGLQIRTLLRGRKPREASVAEGWLEGPPDWLLPLLDGLAAADLVRDHAEPVEAFAARVGAAGHDEAQALLHRYAAFRYGRRGEEAVLAGAVADWTQAPRG